MSRSLLPGLLALLLIACQPQAPAERSRTDRLQLALGGLPHEGFARAVDARAFTFPEDHGPHDAFRNEWWYFTGVLQTGANEIFGYELTFFRVALQPGVSEGWRSRQIYLAHFAVSDVAGERYVAHERIARGAAGLAGARADPFAVWLEDWHVEGGERWQLRAQADDTAIELELTPAMRPVLNGENGLSRKSAAAGNASYYYSLPRIRTRGTVRMAGIEHRVEGSSWLDREWSTSSLGSDQAGWDWFALHLDDGVNLMLYQLRKTDGSIDVHSSGTVSTTAGDVRHLSVGDYTLTPERFWQSPGGGRYPVAWRIDIPSLSLQLSVRAMLDQQWLDLVVPYWEGAVKISGEREGIAVGGAGYLELTGYDPGR